MSETAGMPSMPPLAPYLVVQDAPAAIAFYKKAFGAEEAYVMMTPVGALVMHAHLKLCGGDLMLAEDLPAWSGGKSRSPKALGGTPVTLHLHVDDVESLWARAVDAGCTVLLPLADQFWGDRFGKLADPFGHEWSLAQTVAIPTEEEMMEAMKKMMSGAP